MTLSIVTFNMKPYLATLSKTICHYAKCYYAESPYSFIVMLNVSMVSVVMLNEVMLSVDMLNEDMLNVVMLNEDMLNVVMLNEVMLSVIVLNDVMLSSFPRKSNKCYTLMSEHFIFNSRNLVIVRIFKNNTRYF